MTGFLEDYGLIVLFACIAGQAAGIGPLPGRTVLAAAAVLAARGHYPLTNVLLVGFAGEALGGYAGYLVGKKGGRALVDRFLPARLEPLVLEAESFFLRRGASAVFWARFVPGLKVVAAPAAGLVRMPWWRFAPWHTLAALLVTLLYGLVAYFAGEAAVKLVEDYGLLVAVPLGLVLAAVFYFVVRKRLGPDAVNDREKRKQPERVQG